ncbi:MAG: SPFH domain-containing protein [Planctomycetota bacterium]
MFATFMQQRPDDPNLYAVLIPVFAVLIVFGFVLLLVKRYKRCPSNKILVIYGKVREGHSARCLHGGGAFVWPLIQDYAYLNLDPIQIEIPLKGALSAENIRVNVPSVFTVAVGTDATTMNNAAIRLLGLETKEVMKQAEDIIFGQLRQVIASMQIEDINRDRDKFLDAVQSSLEPELEKIGLVLINVNITDITDASGYIEAIGKKAASQAVQQAEIDVAVQQKLGAIGVAEAERERQIEVASAQKLQTIGVKEAEREQEVRVAELDKERTVGQETARYEQEAQVREAERQMRIEVADANAKAVTGENMSKAEIADANANLAVKEAEAFQLGETRKREADAKVREAQYFAEAKAAEALAQKIEQEKRAELEASARAQKAKSIVDAEALGEQRRIEAKGEADAIYARLEAQARGEFEILAKKGEGLRQIVEGCGGAQEAFQLMVLEHLEKLSENAAKAISGIRFDKVVVWDSGNGKGGTAGFLQGLARSLPPMLNIMRDIGGIEMPEAIGKIVGEGQPAGDGAERDGAAAAPAADPGKRGQKSQPTPTSKRTTGSS